MIVFPSLSKL